ncbi:MAG: alkylphosphonate utilization protein [Bacteroidetes bacterium]|nr:alkylphosphonate utilization protein [Bacteroidota bacterium]
MSLYPNCPKCKSEHTYHDGMMLVCPECGNEWPEAGEKTEATETGGVRDCFGTVLATGDTVSVIKDLKVKGYATAIKAGTKVKNIRLTEGDHPIDCKIEGFGAMQLKSEFVKKV